ncbi:MAG: hypothetical protein Q4E76_04705 [Tissierellia bacterium]|nr:hypothetical protein [Tissierellia bacterium]
MADMNGGALLELLSENEKEVGNLYRDIAKRVSIGERFFELLAEDEDHHHEMYKKLAANLKEEGYWKVDEEQLAYFQLRLDRTLLARPKELQDQGKKVRDKLAAFELAERIERETVEIVREIRDMAPDFVPKELAAIEKEEKGHLQKVMEHIRGFHMTGLGL